MDQVKPGRTPRPLSRFGFVSFLLCFALLNSLFFSAMPRAYAQARDQRTSTQLSEYEVKAACLLNFTKFIEWPPAANQAGTPFVICVLGQDPFGPVLDQIVEGEKVEDRPIVVRRISELTPDPCSILFISKSEHDAGRILSEVRQGVLTVGEMDGFLRLGGMIALVVENRRVRFDVDARAASRGGFKLSSRLLNVARTVENQGRQ